MGIHLLLFFLFWISFCLFSLRSMISSWSNHICGIVQTTGFLNDDVLGGTTMVGLSHPWIKAEDEVLIPPAHSVGRLRCVGSGVTAWVCPRQPLTAFSAPLTPLEWNVSEPYAAETRLLPHSRFFKVGSGKRAPQEGHFLSWMLTSQLITQ